jgi:hypothetical protein
MVGRMRWGGDLSYTLSKADANTWADFDDPFALDAPYIRSSDFTFLPSRYDERHRIVVNLIGRAPFGFLVSTVTTLGSGTPYTISTSCQSAGDFSDPNGFCATHGYPMPSQFIESWAATAPGTGTRAVEPKGQWFGPFGKWAYRNVDLRVEKDFGTLRGQSFDVMLDVFNLFNFTNFNYDNFVYSLRFDATREQIPFSTYPARAAQIGMRYKF